MEETIKAVEKVISAGGFSFKGWTRQGDVTESKILGYNWDAKEDTLCMRLTFHLEPKKRGGRVGPALTSGNLEEQLSRPISRRQVIALAGQFYDPLNLLSPAVVKLRLFYSDACRFAPGKGWDEPISEECMVRLREIMALVLLLNGVKVPRGLFGPHDGHISEGYLIVACDASLQAYATAMYFRPGYLDEESQCKLVMSGVKIAGKASFTAPRMELLGAELGAKMFANTIGDLRRVLTIVGVFFITDSKIVVKQLKLHSGQFDLFTGSRLKKIKDLTKPHGWLHCAGSENPADLPTRSTATLEEMTSEKWLNGGVFSRPQSEWPIKNFENEEVQLLELPGVQQRLGTATDAVPQTLSSIYLVQGGENVEPIFNRLYKRLSSVKRVRKVVAQVLRAVDLWRGRVPRARHERYRDAWQVMLQQEDGNKRARGSKMGGRQVVWRDGVNYAVGRVHSGVLSASFVPIIDKGTPLGDLVARDAHREYGHGSGIKTVQHKLAQEVLILGIGSMLWKLREKCTYCRKLALKRAKAGAGPLPATVTQPSRAFTHIMIDICGPWSVKGAINTRATRKAWMLVILDQFSRGVNVEVLCNITTKSVLDALTRHIAHHGMFSTCHSDCGTQLVKAGKVMVADDRKTVVDLTAVLEKEFPQVAFNHGVPLAPWHQGGVERLIQELKRAFKVTCGDKFEGDIIALETMAKKGMQFVNSRPLLVGPDPDSYLTPNCLLHGRANSSGLSIEGQPEEAAGLMGGLEVVKKSIGEFWKAFSGRESLLRVYRFRDDKQEKIKEGAVVLLPEVTAPGFYRLGRVLSILSGEAADPRTVEVETVKSKRDAKTGESKIVRSKFKRHINTIVLITNHE